MWDRDINTEAKKFLSKSLITKSLEEDDYTYDKMKTKNKLMIGLFIDSNGKVIEEKPAETLQYQYMIEWTILFELFRMENPE